LPLSSPIVVGLDYSAARLRKLKKEMTLRWMRSQSPAGSAESLGKFYAIFPALKTCCQKLNNVDRFRHLLNLNIFSRRN